MKVLKAVGKAVGALLVAAAIWEGLLRLLIASPVPYHHHATLGWMPVPHSRGLNTLEGRGVLVHNELGFRDEPVRPKQPGELRIACLGDSYTAGAQMDASLVYPQRLQSVLRQDLAAAKLPPQVRSVRVINAGRPGTVTSYSVALAEEYLEMFDPDWVVLQVRGGWGELFLPSHEFHYREVGEGFEIRNRWNWEQMGRLKRMFIELGARDLALGQYGLRRLTEMAARKEARGLKDPQEERNLRAIDWTIRELRVRYPRLVLVHIPLLAPTRDGLMAKDSEEDALKESCRRHGVPLIALRGAIERDFPTSQIPSHGFANSVPWSGHPNRHGHALIAEELRAFFARELRPLQ